KNVCRPGSLTCSATNECPTPSSRTLFGRRSHVEADRADHQALPPVTPFDAGADGFSSNRSACSRDLDHEGADVYDAWAPYIRNGERHRLRRGWPECHRGAGDDGGL